MKLTDRDSKIIIFIALVVVLLSHILTDHLFDRTVVEGKICTLFYFILTLPIAWVLAVRNKNKQVSFISSFVLYYAVNVMFLGGLISLLFFAPNYYLADREKPEVVVADIYNVGIANHRYNKYHIVPFGS